MPTPEELSRLDASTVELSMLQSALERGEWFAADWYTRYLMCKIAGRVKEAHLTPESVEAFPCSDLLSIDRNWGEASDGMYGFSAQRCVWIDSGGQAETTHYHEMSREDKLRLRQTEGCFAGMVGWVKDGKYVGFWNEGSLQLGGLPFQPYVCSYGYGLTGLVMPALFARLETCKDSRTCEAMA